MREQAYQSFTQHLLASDVRPGQFVSQRELVNLTEMPLAAIRELIPRLEAEGLITTIPQRGMQIAPIDYNLVRDAYQFRFALELHAIEHFTKTAKDTVINALLDSHEAILRAVQEDGETDELRAEAQAIDWGFHDLIIQSLKNEIIANAYKVNSIKIRLIRQELTRIEGHIEPVMLEHIAVIRALQSRDAQHAVKALKQHIDTARRRALGEPYSLKD